MKILSGFRTRKFCLSLSSSTFLSALCVATGEVKEIQEWKDVVGEVHLGKALTYERGMAKIQIFEDGVATDAVTSIRETDFTGENLQALEEFSVLKDLEEVDLATGAYPVAPGEGAYRCAFLVGPRFASKSYLDRFEKRTYRLMHEKGVLSDEEILKKFLRPSGSNEFELRRNSLALMDDFKKTQAIKFPETVYMAFPMSNPQTYDFENNLFRISIDLLNNKPMFCQFWLDDFHLSTESKKVWGHLKLPPKEGEELVTFLGSGTADRGRLSVLFECTPIGLYSDERRIAQGRGEGAIYFEPKKLTIYASKITSGETRKIVTMEASDFFLRGRNIYPSRTPDKIAPLE